MKFNHSPRSRSASPRRDHADGKPAGNPSGKKVFAGKDRKNRFDEAKPPYKSRRDDAPRDKPAGKGFTTGPNWRLKKQQPIARKATSRRKDKDAAAEAAPFRLSPDHVLVWGQHAVREAWLNPKRRCYRLRLTEAASEAFAATLAQAQDDLLKRPDPGKAERAELDRMTPPGSVHQGIVLEAAPLVEPSLRDVIAGDTPPDLILMLDQVTDPHNVGAILRSAAAFGAGAVIMTERNAPNSTGVLAKSASGALEHVPMIHVVNLARALDELKQAGYWSIGLAEEATHDLAELDLTGRTVLVLGAEGEGLRHLTRQKCDELARLPSGGPIGSLNVSNAAAIGLYEVRRQKKGGG